VFLNKYRYVLLLFGVALISGLAYVYNKADALLTIVSEKPRLEAVSSAEEGVRESRAAVSLEIPFSDLVLVMKEGLTGERIKGRTKKKCYGVGFIKTCFKPKYDLTVVPGEPSVMKAAEDAFLVRLPLDIKGEVSSGGRIGNHMPISSRILLLAEGRANMLEGSECPEVVFDLDYRWLKPPKAKLKTVGNNSIKIDLTRKINPKINKKLKAYQSRLSDAFDCKEIKRRLLESAQVHSKPLGAKAGKEPLAYLDVVPKGLGFSGLDLSNEDSLKMAFMIRFDMAILSHPSNEEKPVQSADIVMESIDSEEGQIDVLLPVSLSYEKIRGKLSDHLLGYKRVISSIVPVEAGVEDIDIYPSSDYLTVGLKIKTGLLNGLIAKTSWLYFRVKPELIDKGKKLGFSTPVLTEIENDPLVDVLGFRDQLREALQRTRFDIDSSVRSMMDDLVREMEMNNATLKVDVQHGQAAFERLYPDMDALRIVFNYKAKMRAILQARNPVDNREEQGQPVGG